MCNLCLDGLYYVKNLERFLGWVLLVRCVWDWWDGGGAHRFAVQVEIELCDTVTSVTVYTDNKYVDAVWELTLAAWPYT